MAQSQAELDKYYIDIDIKFETIDGEVQLVTNTEAVIQNIVFVLLTEKGSIDFEPPDFGCSLTEIIFENYKTIDFSKYADDIKLTLNKYVYNAHIRDVQFIVNKAQRAIQLEVYFTTDILPEVVNKIIVDTRRRLL